MPYNPFGLRGYRSPLAQNPYLSSVMQGIDLLLSDAQQKQQRSQAIELENQRFERSQNVATQTRKFNILEGITKSKDLTPATREKGFDFQMEMLRDPDVDISGLEPKIQTQEPETETPEELFPTSAIAQRVFPNMPKELPFDLRKVVEVEATKRWKALLDKDKGPGTGKGEDSPEMKTISDYKERMLKLWHQGIQKTGYTGSIDQTVISRYLQQLDDLERAYNENGKLNEKEQKILDALKPPEVSATEVGGAIKGMSDQDAETLRLLREAGLIK